jgi:hypothetical protein
VFTARYGLNIPQVNFSLEIPVPVRVGFQPNLDFIYRFS